MQVKSLAESRGFFTVLGTARNLQTASMVLAPGQESGQRGNEHPESEQALLVVSGTVRAEINGRSFALASGDSIIVPLGAAHRFWNEGDEPAVTFTVYAPPAY